MLLARLGSIFLKTVGIISGVVPLLAPKLPPKIAEEVKAASDDLTAVGSVIVTTEQLFTNAYGEDAKRGSDKLAASVPFVMQILQNSEHFAGHKLIDQDMLNAGATDICNGMVKAFKAFEAKDK